jgi:predicted RNA-binding protein with PUA-like domain
MAKKYWLFKTDADCYSIDDLLASPKSTDHWDGVRNCQARNLLRDEIKKGDGIFIYHSSCKQIGIAGIGEVAKSGYPDHTALDKSEKHFDPKSTKENPIWYMVDVKVTKKLDSVLPLSVIKQTPGLEKMMLVQRGARLSVQPVTASEWKIVNKLIQ